MHISYYLIESLAITFRLSHFITGYSGRRLYVGCTDRIVNTANWIANDLSTKLLSTEIVHSVSYFLLVLHI